MSQSANQKRGVAITVAALLVLIAVIVGGFVHKINQPRVLTPSELQINRTYLFDQPRMLPDGMVARIDTGSWTWPAVFSWLQEQGNVASFEMYRTLNCGVGMVVCVAEDQVDTCLSVLQQQGEQAWVLGRVAAGEGEARVELND